MTTTLLQEESAVRSVLDRIYAAWADNDANAFVAPYAPEATATLPGASLRNREAIRATMAALFAQELKGSRAAHSVESVRFLGADVAIVRSKGAIILAGQCDPAPASWALETWVLSRTTGSWRVEAFHNCPAGPRETEA
jgi:uncharacterized protein (TIGR02246 family)